MTDIGLVKDGGSEFMQYMKERDQAKELLREKEKELQQSQTRNYELVKKCETLEQQLNEQKKKSTGTKHSTSNNHGSKKHTSKPSKKEKSVTKADKASKQPKKGTVHPIIPNREEIADNSLLFYTAVSELCPDIKLSVIRNTEKLFLEGDVNGDGLIDVDELDTLFTKHLGLYTKKQTEEILESVDEDGSKSLDFIETLHVMHQLDIGAKTKLPPNSIQKGPKGTAVCLIQ